MPQRPWEEYYAKVIRRPHRPQVEQAAALVNKKPQRVAIDCGCGAGPDTAYLLAQGFEVHAFDSEDSAVKVCQQRFADNESVHVTHCSFEAFDYPAADLIVANASLFFCEPDKFPAAWRKLSKALQPGGVFCGDFLGLNDGWLAEENGDTLAAFAEAEVRVLFAGFDLISWSEKDEIGRTAIGPDKHWHYYTVIATKQS